MSPDFNIQVWLQNQDNFSAIRDISTYLSNNSPNSSSCPSAEIIAFAEDAIEANMNSPFEVDLFDFVPDENIDITEVETVSSPLNLKG